MHEILNSFKQKNPSQNFKKNSSTLKNPKNFQKLQNLGFKTWNACKWEKRNLPSEKRNLRKLENPLERGLEWERVFWEVKRQVCRERDRKKWEGNRDSRLNKSLVNLNR